MMHQTEEGGFGYKITSLVDIFTTDLTPLYVTLRRIGEVIQHPEKCLILTDNLSSVKAHSSVVQENIASDSSADLRM
jgi:hypothetical protein